MPVAAFSSFGAPGGFGASTRFAGPGKATRVVDAGATGAAAATLGAAVTDDVVAATSAGARATLVGGPAATGGDTSGRGGCDAVSDSASTTAPCATPPTTR